MLTPEEWEAKFSTLTYNTLYEILHVHSNTLTNDWGLF